MDHGLLTVDQSTGSLKNMKKTLIVLLHLMLSSAGYLEYCFSRGIRKFRFNLDYHYSCRIPCQHPAYQDVSIAITKHPHESRITSHMLYHNTSTNIPQCMACTLSLN